METAAIYGLAKLLGHEALSMNAIIAIEQMALLVKTQTKL